MPEEVLFESESRQTRAAVADYFRTVADRLDDGGDLTLTDGDKSVTVAVPDRPTFEVKAEREGSAPDTELSVEFELEWDEDGGAGGDGDLSIE